MSATKCLAFVLKTQDYRDTSLLTHFLTREFGKVQGIVKGVRDARGRYGSTLEPFSLNEILFYRRRRGAELHQVTAVEMVHSYPKLRQDLERTGYASYFAEVIHELIESDLATPELFDLMKDSLHFLSTDASVKRVARIFEIKLLETLGLMPQMSTCVLCQKNGPDPALFSASLGGIACRECADDSPAGARLVVSKGTTQFIEHVRRASIAQLGGVKVAQGVGEELERIFRRFVDYQLSRKLNSLVFLEKMGYI